MYENFLKSNNFIVSFKKKVNIVYSYGFDIENKKVYTSF